MGTQICERFSLLKSDSSFGRDGIAERNGHPWYMRNERASRRIFQGNHAGAKPRFFVTESVI